VEENNQVTETNTSGIQGSSLPSTHGTVVDIDIALPANQRIDISIAILPDGRQEKVIEVVSSTGMPAPIRRIKRPFQLPPLALPKLSLSDIRADARVLFGLAFGLYLLLTLVNLPAFPTYFFCDEAVNPVLASDFLRDGFRNHDGVFFPTFFKNGGQYCLSTTVYMHTLTYVLFGKAVWVTRSLSAIVSAFSALFLALMMRDVFKSRIWWSAPLWLVAIPTWFLHTRGAFEYAPMVMFYTGFIYFYLRYRTDRPNMLYPALLFGALAFYTYTPGQLIVVVTGLLLLSVDIRYHLKHWRTALRGAALLILLAAPFIRFVMMMPDEYSNRLSMYGSYWASDLSLTAKFGSYFRIYLSGLNPVYWFLPHNQDNPLHTMKGYGHISWIMLVPFAVGLWQALRQWRAPEMRTILAVFLAAPAGTAMAALHPNRVLTMVIPVVVLGMIGFCTGVEWIKQKRTIRTELFCRYGSSAGTFQHLHDH
jgi:hypothetical protein